MKDTNLGALVQLPDGSFARKPWHALLPDDRLVLDGPDSFSGVEALQALLDAEIAKAGGLEAWRRLCSPSPQQS